MDQRAIKADLGSLAGAAGEAKQSLYFFLLAGKLSRGVSSRHRRVPLCDLTEIRTAVGTDSCK